MIFIAILFSLNANAIGAPGAVIFPHPPVLARPLTPNSGFLFCRPPVCRDDLESVESCVELIAEHMFGKDETKTLSFVDFLKRKKPDAEFLGASPYGCKIVIFYRLKGKTK